MDRIPHDDGTRPCAVYRLFDADGRLLYVGIAFDVTARLGAHKKERAWWGDVARAEVCWMDSRTEADIAETIAAILENPKHNNRKRHGLGLSESWVPALGMELRSTDAVSPAAFSASVAPGHIAKRIGIKEGAPVILSSRFVVRGERVIAWLACWQSPWPGSVTARDDGRPHDRLSPHVEHRDASEAEAAAIAVEPGCLIDAAWRSPDDRSAPGRPRHSIAELISACRCP